MRRLQAPEPHMWGHGHGRNPGGALGQMFGGIIVERNVSFGARGGHCLSLPLIRGLKCTRKQTGFNKAEATVLKDPLSLIHI